MHCLTTLIYYDRDNFFEERRIYAESIGLHRRELGEHDPFQSGFGGDADRAAAPVHRAVRRRRVSGVLLLGHLFHKPRPGAAGTPRARAGQLRKPDLRSRRARFHSERQPDLLP